ncbi:hypothetical protein AWC31_29730 [Mycolicibacterium wolinskyi]|uniref:Uncharacterized protein n=1 Tax=Mycolicibacterium wolinskyi TaxID=59750 RepID=A0A1X2F679_9MYCO|nr:hypothetical protein AWC31_29730 [Mycolicibacterium wolinskyi]
MTGPTWPNRPESADIPAGQGFSSTSRSTVGYAATATATGTGPPSGRDKKIFAGHGVSGVSERDEPVKKHRW